MATKASQHQPTSRKRTEAGVLKRVGEAVKIHGSYRWRKLSLYKRQINPVCEWCSKHGKTREAVAVHHLQPIEVAPHLAYEITNLMSCCRDCHDYLEKHPDATVPPVPENVSEAARPSIQLL